MSIPERAAAVLAALTEMRNPSCEEGASARQLRAWADRLEAAAFTSTTNPTCAGGSTCPDPYECSNYGCRAIRSAAFTTTPDAVKPPPLDFPALIRALDPWYVGESGESYCFFCGTWEPMKHRDGCLWKAVQL